MFSNLQKFKSGKLAGTAAIGTVSCLAAFWQFSDEYQPQVSPKTSCGFLVGSFSIDEVTCNIDQKSDAGDHANRFSRGRVMFQLNQPNRITPNSITLVSGEKSVVAGKGTYMAMALVQGPNGETVFDGTKVSFLNSAGAHSVATTLGGVAFVNEMAPTKTGNLITEAKTGSVSALAKNLRVVPNELTELKLDVDALNSELLENQQLLVGSKRLKDRFDNTLTDGTTIKFAGKDKDGKGILLSTKVINGKVQAKLLTRGIKKTFSLTAHQNEIRGEQLNLAVVKSELDEKTRTTVILTEGCVDLEIGPLRYADGNFVEDGLAVTVRLEDGDELVARTVSGVARFKFTHPSQDDVAVLEARARDINWVIDIDQAKHAISERSIVGRRSI